MAHSGAMAAEGPVRALVLRWCKREPRWEVGGHNVRSAAASANTIVLVEELLARLHKADIAAESTLSGLAVAIPRRPRLLRRSLIAAVVVVMLYVLLTVLAMFLDGGMLGIILLWLGTAGLCLNMLGIAAGMLDVLLLEVSPTYQQRTSQKLMLSLHTVQVGTHSIPLEDITAVRVLQQLDVRTLLIRYDGREIPLSRSEINGREVLLKELIEQLIEARRAQLIDEGHDLSSQGRAPEVLARLREGL